MLHFFNLFILLNYVYRPSYMEVSAAPTEGVPAQGLSILSAPCSSPRLLWVLMIY
jgi:hypothetical protein